MRCDRARTSFLAGDAGEDELHHLDKCPDCRAERTALDTTRRALEDTAMWEEPSPRVADQVVSMISGVAGEPPTRRKLPRLRLVAAAAVVVAAVATLALLRPPQPDWEVAMPGTAAAPGATASVKGWNEPTGTRLLLSVTGLPEAPPGSLYELWLTRDSVHVSAGTFTAAGDVEMWVGVSRRDYPRLWVTLEPVDDDESLSGVNMMDTGY